MSDIDIERKSLSEEEIQNLTSIELTEIAEAHDQIFEAVTPKNTIDWYLKWASSIIILGAISVRASGVPELIWIDMLLSWIGACGWFVVSYMWRDRALILLNGVIGIVLFSGLINYFFG
jgi:hypothetical protein